jgi:hypothetical protein
MARTTSTYMVQVACRSLQPVRLIPHQSRLLRPRCSSYTRSSYTRLHGRKWHESLAGSSERGWRLLKPLHHNASLTNCVMLLLLPVQVPSCLSTQSLCLYHPTLTSTLGCRAPST